MPRALGPSLPTLAFMWYSCKWSYLYSPNCSPAPTLQLFLPLFFNRDNSVIESFCTCPFLFPLDYVASFPRNEVVVS